MDTVKIENLQYLQIGIQGEHNALQVPIDMSSWADELAARFPERRIGYHLLFKPYNESHALPMTTTYDGTDRILTWDVTLAATLVQGLGYTEIRAITDSDDEVPGLVKKTKVIPTLVDQSASGAEGGSVPAPYEDWVNSVLIFKDQLNDIFDNAVTKYAVSSSYSSHPTSESSWSTTMPDLSQHKGEYLWNRTEFEWSTGAKSYIYSVNYIAMDSDTGVVAINGETGNVSLDGRTLYVDNSASAKETLKAAINRLGQLATITNLNGVLQPAHGGTGTTSLKYAIKDLMNSSDDSSSVPATNDRLLVARATDGYVSRRKIADVLSTVPMTSANIYSKSGGAVVKTATISMTRNIVIADTVFATSKGEAHFRFGYYQGTYSYNAAQKVPLALTLPTGVNLGTNVTYGGMQISGSTFKVPWFQIKIGNFVDSDAMINPMTMTLHYLALT